MTTPAARTDPPARHVVNPSRDPAWTCEPVAATVRAFHRTLPGYERTPLVDLPELARELGVAHVAAKDESQRLGLPAFKALGASWAIQRTLAADDRVPTTNDQVPAADAAGSDTRSTAGRQPDPEDATRTIVTATDGNHGRAVARSARLAGHEAHIFVPDGVHPAAVAAIRDEGATVTHVPGTYDNAVRVAADHAGGGPDRVLVQDTAWPGYEEIPGWIVDGYATLFDELDEQVRSLGGAGPVVLLVPTGVGSLLQAALTHARSAADPAAVRVVAVEPLAAACVLASIEAGRPVQVATGTTTMAGLNCGSVSSLAWPVIAPGLDEAVAIDDEAAARAARDLARQGVDAGPCGAAPLAAARALQAGGGPGIAADATVVLLVTEGTAANPAA